MKSIFRCLLVFTNVLIYNIIWGQVSGKITDIKGEALSYATIYIEGTTTGTISNVDGAYLLELPSEGSFTIIYQYVGYAKESIRLNYSGKTIVQNVVLKIDENILGELVINADREDPAYAIIRKAIAKRSYYNNLIKSFEADLYVKGTVKINRAPKEILGEKIGNMGGVLDSARQGIVYLSESKSKFYFMAPNKTKEVMISSITSGENNLFTANQFSIFSFNMYEEYISFSRAIVTPLADHALSHYKYTLDQTTIDQNGMTIHKIKLTPKSTHAPLLQGYIYINDDLWNISSIDLKLCGTALKGTLLDTINLKQVFVPVGQPDKWKLLSQVVNFKAALFGFKMGGTFSYIFSNYNLNADVKAVLNNNETFRVEQKALNKDTAFWNNERPIPLTKEEKRDYVKKDSLSKIWHSRTFLDSTDRVENKFGISDILIGYTWNNSFKKIKYVYPSPLSTIRFNAVEGFKLNLDSYWEWSDSTFRKLTIHPVFEYGFTDKKIKSRLLIEYKFDNLTLGSIALSGGRQYVQFDPRQPVNERNNTWSSLYSKLNEIRLYQRDFIQATYKQEVTNGLFVQFTTEYTDRQPLNVLSNYSFRKKEQPYAQNIPRTDLSENVYSRNKYWKSRMNLLLRPSQKYSSFPNIKIRDVSDWPNIELDYEVGIPLESSSKLFDKLMLRIRDRYVTAKLLGYYSYNIELGTSLGSTPSFFGDFFHPIGNELLAPIDPDLASFNLMPFYSYSTNSYYSLVNFRHHFNGYITDKIPLINKTSLKLVTGFSAMYSPLNGKYWEVFIGLESFKLGPVTLFGIDYTWAYNDLGYTNRGVTIRLSNILNN
ncbi:MAG: carboxypeptidase-like regulatory domain-containing protein [Saprospiraceae bacterium]|nr:carboxypeptidase-like regulatory domain-containing protein [Saprospiraceae bacterium]